MRVIAGSLGGRRLVAPRGLATRPTTDRVREALFSVIGDVSGAAVLDLFAGTGALGVEALSRGAARAVFVESARPALAALRANLAALGLEARGAVVAVPVARALDAVARAGPYDLVFADPPYDVADEALAALVALASRDDCLAPGVLVALEHASRRPLDVVAPFSLRETRRYGDTAISLFGRLGPAAP
jgi:16S rRNA (guanine966-N2)-methyltransferase